MAKIMVIHHCSSIGGGSISFLDVLDMLKDDHEIIGCCPKGTTEFNEYMKSRGHETIELDFPIPTFNHYNGGPSKLTRTFWSGINNLKFGDKIKKIIELHNPEIVIVNSSVMCFLGDIIKSCGVKSICLVRETFNESVLNVNTKIMFNILNNNFDGVGFISSYDKSFANLRKPVTGVIADCLDNKLYTNIEKDKACEKLGISKGKFNLLYVGGISWLKGIDVLLKAISLIDNTDVKLIVAGDINLNSEGKGIKGLVSKILNPMDIIFYRKIRKLIDREDVKEKVEFVGVQKDMSICYSACDVTVFPSNLPHQSRPVFEAGVYYMPIIISDFNQTKEYVANEENGLTFKPRNEKDLLRCILSLYKDENKRKVLGNENYSRIKKLHDFDNEKEKMLKFIEKVLKK